MLLSVYTTERKQSGTRSRDRSRRTTQDGGDDESHLPEQEDGREARQTSDDEDAQLSGSVEQWVDREQTADDDHRVGGIDVVRSSPVVQQPRLHMHTSVN